MNTGRQVLCNLLFGILATVSGSIAAEVYYKWVDDQGTVHYGEAPSPIYESSPIKASDSYAAETEEAKNSLLTEKELAQKEEARKFCKIAQENLEVLNSGDKIEQRDQYGNLHALSAEELTREKELAQTAVQKFCSTQKLAVPE